MFNLENAALKIKCVHSTFWQKIIAETAIM